MIDGLIGLMATVVTDPSTFDPVAYNAPAPHVEHPLFTLPEPATIALGLIGGGLLVLFVRAKRYARLMRSDAGATVGTKSRSSKRRQTRTGKKKAA